MVARPRLTPAIADVRRAVRDAWELAGVSVGDTIVLACSGGADSLALAIGSLFEAKKLGITPISVVVNHNLQKGSMEVALNAQKTLMELGFATVEVVEVQVVLGSLGMEAAARTARYEAIDNIATRYGARYSMLGHTLDDQAETVLLGLARGSGPRSIAGMSIISADGKYLRPLLGLRRETTVAACVDSGIAFWEDPQNSDPKFSRVRVRKNVLPVLESELGPGIAQALARTAELVQIDNDYLDLQTNIAFHESATVGNNSVILRVEELFELAPAIRSRVIHNALILLGAEPSKSHIDSVSSLLTNWHGQKPLTLPAVRVVREGQEIILKSTKTIKPGAC